MGGYGDARGCKTAALFRLGRRMVDFEAAKSGVGFEPIGEGVEPGAEDEDLPDAAFNRDARNPRRSGCARR